MSPEIRINKELIADVPDETGYYKTLAGDDLYVNVDGINPDNTVQQIVVQTSRLAGTPGKKTEDGTRVINLSALGTGSQMLPSGDQVYVTLRHRPIRETIYTRREVPSYLLGPRRTQTIWTRSTQTNPRWQRGHGHRG